MSNPWAKDRATQFYLGLGLFGLLIVALGFGVTYALPMMRRTFSAPWYVHLHGAFALGWVLLFIAQAVLVRRSRSPLHRRLGQAGLPLAILVFLTGMATAVWAARRDLPSVGSVATSGLAGTFTGLGLFVVVAVAAVALRRHPDWHKRLVVLATIQLLWPAFFRLRHLLPMVPRPEFTLALGLAYAPILIAAYRDYRLYGRVHPVWAIVAPILFVEQCLEVVWFDQGLQRSLGEWLFARFT